MRRKTTEKDRWDYEHMNKIKGAPWEPAPGQGDAEIKSKIRLPQDRANQIPEIREKEMVTRRVRIYQTHLDKYGVTAGCRGCEAMNRGSEHKPHSE